jgi:serine/threonine protein kinase
MIPKLDPPRLPNSDQYSEDFNDFIQACLKKDPQDRPTASELLKHKFILSAGNKAILQELVHECLPKIEKFRTESLSEKATRKDNTSVSFALSFKDLINGSQIESENDGTMRSGIEEGKSEDMDVGTTVIKYSVPADGTGTTVFRTTHQLQPEELGLDPKELEKQFLDAISTVKEPTAASKSRESTRKAAAEHKASAQPSQAPIPEAKEEAAAKPEPSPRSKPVPPKPALSPPSPANGARRPSGGTVKAEPNNTDTLMVDRERFISKGSWMPDNASDECLICKIQFTFFRRRHHCRSWYVICHILRLKADFVPAVCWYAGSAQTTLVF